ncbi:uncharacterized protein A1O9_10012, partial [Exophiala aquamarina CBS 119918]
ARYDTPDEVDVYLDTFLLLGGRYLDTARLYPPEAPGTAEVGLGKVEAGKKFIIDTKVFSQAPGSAATETVHENVNTSLKVLNTL